jgi:hypothetical protein
MFGGPDGPEPTFGTPDPEAAGAAAGLAAVRATTACVTRALRFSD